MSTKLKVFYGTVASFLLPMLAFAQIVTNDTVDADSFLVKIQGWINTLMPIIVALALLYFLYGLLKFMTAGGDSEKRKESRDVMLWGIIALFVMVSVWGLVSFLGNTLGISAGGTVNDSFIPGVE